MSAPSGKEINAYILHMACIAVVPDGDGVGASLVFWLTDLIQANLVIQFEASSWVPDLSASMVEPHTCDGKVRHDVLGVDNTEECAVGEESHDVICEDLVACSW